MAADIKRPPCAAGFVRIHVCKQDTLLAIEWTCGYRSAWPDDDGTATIDPFLWLEEPVAVGKLSRNISKAH